MLNFKLDHNNISYDFTLVIEKDFIYHNRYLKLSHKSEIALKKNEISPYSLTIQATSNDFNLTFFISSVILPTDLEEVIEELNQYLVDEEIIDKIEEKMISIKSVGKKPSWAE